MMPENNRRTASRVWGSRFFLPSFAVLSFVSFFLSCIVCYAIFKAMQHDEKGQVPFISDTGAYRPESCVFGQMLNITALIVGLTAYFRTKQVEALLEHLSLPQTTVECCGCSVMTLNSCFFGIVSAIGMSIVGNFQETQPTLIPHLIGAGMAFFLGMVYVWKQTVLSWRLRHHEQKKISPFIKLGVTVSGSLAILGMVISAGILLTKTDAAQLPYRNSAAVFEWITAMFMALYFITFVWDFKSHVATSPKIVINGYVRGAVDDVNTRIENLENGQIMGPGQNSPHQAV